MKKLGVLTGLVTCVVAGFNVSSWAYPMQESALLQRCLQYERVLTTPADCPPQQRLLVALTLAAAEVPPFSPAEYRQVYEQAGILVFYRKTSDTGFIWSGTEWTANHRTSYSYASGSRVSEEITQTFDGAQWNNASRTTNTYDGFSRPSTSTSQAWQTGVWANETMSTFTYDVSGNAIELLLEKWQTGAWVNFSKTTMTYTGGRIATSTSQLWQASAWENAAKTTFTYDGLGHLTETLMQNWQSNAWVNSMRFTSTFDGSGRETSSITQMWSGSDWTNTYKDEYSYDGSGHEILTITSMWAGALWMATDADTSKYSGDYLAETVRHGILTNMLNRTRYMYDGFGNLIEDISDNAMVGDPWNNQSRNVYVYESYLGIFDETPSSRADAFTVQNYPNPFNAGTVIGYTLKRDCQVQVTISNLLGQRVATLLDADQSAGSHNAYWDGRDERDHQVSSGIYFFRVQAGGVSQVRKMVLLR